MDTQSMRESKEYMREVAECEAKGGHCYEQGYSTIMTDPRTFHRICKHCGHTQHGTQQSSMRWE